MILFDAHVHIYDCFDIATFFEAAAENFAAAAQKNGDQTDCARFLLLTESNGLDYFQKLPELLSSLNGKQKNPYWNIEEKEPGLSYVVSKNDQTKDEMIIVAGRQLVTAEGLELLALMTADKFEDGMSLEEAVGKVTGSGGIAVCPWGAGKWLGRR